MEWIKVEDKLPEELREVLLFYGFGRAIFYFCGYYKDGVFYNNSQSKPLHTITYWAPLLRPPKP